MEVSLPAVRETRPLSPDDPRLSCIQWPRCRQRAAWLIRGTSLCDFHARERNMSARFYKALEAAE